MTGRESLKRLAAFFSVWTPNWRLTLRKGVVQSVCGARVTDLSRWSWMVGCGKFSGNASNGVGCWSSGRKAQDTKTTAAPKAVEQHFAVGWKPYLGKAT